VSRTAVTLVELDDVVAQQVRGESASSRAFAAGFPRGEDLDALAAWERGAMGFLIVDGEGRVVGTCGTHGAPAAGVVELGFGLVQCARGVGVGGETVDLLLAAVRERHPAARVVARTQWELVDGVAVAASPASEAILERRGFIPDPAPVDRATRGWSLKA
jgi:RimJ/RimL family protein N-acetyltransferase